MKALLLSFIGLVLAFGWVSPAAGQLTPAETDAVQLLESLGLRAELEAGLDAQLAQLPRTLPPSFGAYFRQELSVDSLLVGLGRVYLQHFSPAEIAELRALHQHPTAQKLNDLRAELARASREVGVAVGRRAAERARLRVANDGK